MTTGASDLDELWRAMPPPAGPLLEARAVGTWPGGQLLAAVDSDRRRHLFGWQLVAPKTSGLTTTAASGFSHSHLSCRTWLFVSATITYNVSEVVVASAVGAKALSSALARADFQPTSQEPTGVDVAAARSRGRKNCKQILVFKSLDGQCTNRLASSRQQDCPGPVRQRAVLFIHVWSST